MIFLTALVILAACSSPVGTPLAPPSGGTSSVTPAKVFSDPFDYCASVGTIDAPDSRYTGDPVPDAVINGFKKAAGLEASTEPMDMFKKTTSWRCMDGKVVACNVGANLPCSSKADTNKTPTQAMQDYCSANPGSDFIPMSVTGHATIYSWHCAKDGAELLKQIVDVDAAGYLANIWYAISPNP